MLIDFLEEGLICLEVSCPSMETKDAHEHILVVGEVCHCLDILDMGVPVLTKRMYACTTRVQTQYIIVCQCTEYVLITFSVQGYACCIPRLQRRSSVTVL